MTDGPDWARGFETVIAAAPPPIFAVMANTADWPRWNAGVARVVLHDGFVTGSRFTMTMPDGESIDSVLTDVTPDGGFVDETRIGEVRVVVRHIIEPRTDGHSVVRYEAEVTGPDAAAIGAAVTADFPNVLAGLKRVVETGR